MHRHYIDHEFMGLKWQSVEFVRRFLYLTYAAVFIEVPQAYDVFSLRFVRHVPTGRLLPLNAFANGSTKGPEKGAILVWLNQGVFKNDGHVAIITEVLPNKVRVAEQNVDNAVLSKCQSWTRELPLVFNDGHYCIHDTFLNTRILGWMIQTDDCQNSLPKVVVQSDLLKIHLDHCEENSHLIPDKLDPKDDLEQAYHAATDDTMAHTFSYYTLSNSAEKELIKATEELHLMYMHATDVVIHDDELLKRFTIPRVLWPTLRSSWRTERQQLITGRFDFCLDEKGIKVYEYNVDSASCHTEASAILTKWSSQVNLRSGHNPGEELQRSLVAAWRNSCAEPFVHIMQDNDKEEDYHALFMQRILTLAGFETKVLRGMDKIKVNSLGQFIDEQGRTLRAVWKTWSWETVFEALRKALGGAQNNASENNNKRVSLTDVLLCPSITIFEPLWTVIPSNKAILPVLWSLYRNHPYLLESAFCLTNQLIATGYAMKPIAGRRGDNIQLVAPQEHYLMKTGDAVKKYNSIYQQLCCLPKIENNYLQFCTFTVAGHYNGACLRSDPSQVIKGESKILPLWIENDIDFLRKQ